MWNEKQNSRGADISKIRIMSEVILSLIHYVLFGFISFGNGLHHEELIACIRLRRYCVFHCYHWTFWQNYLLLEERDVRAVALLLQGVLLYSRARLRENKSVL